MSDQAVLELTATIIGLLGGALIVCLAGARR